MKTRVTTVTIAGKQIDAALAICPICKTLDLGTKFLDTKNPVSWLAQCPKGHAWTILTKP